MTISIPAAIDIEAARADLAPSGRLRAGLNMSNPLFNGTEATTGEISGVSVDLMRELASRLEVPLELVPFASPGDIINVTGTGRWDVAMLAIEPARADTVEFSPPVTAIEATYAVHDDSPLTMAAEADAIGLRIAAQAKAGYEQHLARTLRHATLVSTTSFDESIACFNDGGADLVACLRPVLHDALPRMRQARILDGGFMTVNHGLCAPRGRSIGAAFLKAFVEQMSATGFIARSIERHQVRGLSAA